VKWQHFLSIFIPLTLGTHEDRASAFAQESRILIGVGQSQTVRVPQLSRVSVSTGRLVKVRAFPPATLVMTGLRTGKATIRAWDIKGSETVFHAEVIPADLFAVTSGMDEPEVIKVKLEFLELDRSLSQTLGFRWPESFQFSGQASVNGSPSTTGLNYSAGISSARGLIQHLLREGWAKLLARPELFVRLGEQAVFHSGGEIPVATSSEQYGRHHRHVEWKPYGLTVKVRPKSGDKLHFDSDINVEVSELNPAQGLEGVPAINRRHVNTKMHSRDGETVILSGLVRQAAHSGHEGIPGLSSIPLLGSLLFSNRSEGTTENEIVMAVTFSLATRSDHRRARELSERYEGASLP